MPQSFSYPITFLHCKNLAEIRSFYEGILHLTAIFSESQCIIYKIGKKNHFGYWGFCSHYSDFLEHPERICLTLVVDTKEDVDAWYKELVSKNVKCIKKPAYMPEFKIYSSFYRDPMNHTLEIQVFDENSKLI